jgi:hypothetical protein
VGIVILQRCKEGQQLRRVRASAAWLEVRPELLICAETPRSTRPLTVVAIERHLADARFGGDRIHASGAIAVFIEETRYCFKKLILV